MQDEITSSQESQESFSDIFPPHGTFSTDDGLLSGIEMFNSEEEQIASQPNGTNVNITGQNQYLDIQSSSVSHTSYVTQSTIQMPNEALFVDPLPYPVPSIMSPICVPPKNSWTGDYGFDVHFGQANKTFKGVSWIYASTTDKLYVMKDSPCPIDIVVRRNVPDGCIVRVMAMYSLAAHSQELVRRCINHALKDMKTGMQHPYHLIRCECVLACYESSENGQMSVTVPYERPPIGESCSTYIFKFACFGSCAGGPNRRPLLMIFTLEKEKKCASSEKRKIDHDPYSEHVSSLFQFIDTMQDSGKKPEPVANKDGTYTITVNDRALYNFLVHARMLYELNKTMSQFSPNIMSYLKSVKKPKKDGDSTDASD